MSDPTATATFPFPFQEQATKFQEQATKLQDQYKQAFDTAAKSWAEAVQKLSVQVPSNSPDLKSVVERAFELAELQLRAQRDYVTSTVEVYTRANATTNA